MRQPLGAKRPTPEPQANESPANFAGQSVDEWLAAAVAEQASRAAIRKAELAAPTSETQPDPGIPEPTSHAGSEPSSDVAASESAPSVVEPEVPASPETPARAKGRISSPEPVSEKAASLSGADRLSVETAAKTAAALGSVTSWIERAQDQLTAATVASTEAHKRTEAVVSDAIGALGRRLEQIERKVDTVAEDGPALGADGHPRPGRGGPIGRRGVSAQEEIEAAVHEIRTHQADLSRGPETGRPGEGPKRPQTGFLAALRAESGGGRPEATGHTPADLDLDGVFALRRELDDLRASVDVLATREQVSAIEQSLNGLAIDLADVRHRGGELASLAGSADTIHAEIQRLADQRGPADQFDKFGRDIDVLSHKLDIVAAGGIDPAVIDGLVREVGDIRELHAASTAGPDLSVLDEQLAEMRREIARISARQVDPREFTTLRIAVEEIRQTVARVPAETDGVANAADTQAALQQIARDEIGPVLALMAELGRKIERLEQSVSDTAPLDGIEREIASLAKVVADAPHSDTALASLHQGLSDLMAEVASWREGTVEIAERVARRIAEETLAGLRQVPAVQEPAAYSDTAQLGKMLDERAQESLQTVHTRLEDVVRRIGRLDSPGAPPAETPAPVHQPVVTARLPQPEERYAPDDYDRTEPHEDPRDDLLAEADRPLPPHAPESRQDKPDEILLEPGADRPRPTVLQTEPVGDSSDIKASFIAAARRAAQAAAADANRSTRSNRFSDTLASTASGPANQVPSRARAALDRMAKPLLIGAAAIVIALGGLRLASNMSGGSSNRIASGSERTTPPLISAPARNASPSPDAPDPTTTQGLPSPNSDRQLAQPVVQSSVPDSAASTGSVPAEPAPVTARLEDATSKVEVTKAPEVARVDPPKAEAPRPKVEASLSAPAQPLPAAVAPTDTVPSQASASALAGLKQAAATGDSVALYELGARTADGRGVTRDAKAAAGLFEKAADRNFAPAQYRTGNIYEKGLGVPRDIEAAKKWYGRAAENGNTRAMHNLAVLIAEGGGGKPDYASATTWFQRAAEYGVRDSQFNLAVLAARGLGGNQDLIKSYTWFSIAASQGDDEAGRKREEVGSRLSATDLAKAKAAAERWKPLPASTAANEVQLPPGGWSSADAGAAKKPVR